jgi:hypothetical protein
MYRHANGHFDKPFQTHGEVPPGVAEMQKSSQKIAYRYEDLPQGGAVRIGRGSNEFDERVRMFR